MASVGSGISTSVLVGNGIALDSTKRISVGG